MFSTQDNSGGRRKRAYLSEVSPAENAIARITAAGEKAAADVARQAARRAEARSRLEKSGAFGGPKMVEGAAPSGPRSFA